LFQCNNISVSVNGSVGRWPISFFTKFFLLSSNAFLARILDSDNAETFGSFDDGISIFLTGSEITGAIIAASGSFLGTDASSGALSTFDFGLSTIE
jgi:hypothetical protein